MASLIVTSGDQTGEYLPLGRRTSVIGRAESLPLQVLDDLVSRKHLRICFEDATGKYYAEDMNSKHGVFVNKHKITEPAALTDGDEILIGNVTLLFTDENITDRESALTHYKKVGERKRTTIGD
jgi:pSer/pThr/pTyr-binding forkhead associated (FHA) protein